MKNPDLLRSSKFPMWARFATICLMIGACLAACAPGGEDGTFSSVLAPLPAFPLEVVEVENGWAVEQKIIASESYFGHAAWEPTTSELYFIDQVSGELWALDASPEISRGPWGQKLVRIAALPSQPATTDDVLALSVQANRVHVLALGPAGDRLQVVRFDDQFFRWDTLLTHFDFPPVLVVDDLPFATTNPGGSMITAPDGSIIIGLGDGGESGKAQQPGEFAGHLLRFSPDGSIPADNPDPQSPIYASGLRNPTGLFLLPDGRIIVRDERPQGQEECTFYVQAGADYGWPNAALATEPSTEAFCWTESYGLSGVSSYYPSVFRGRSTDMLYDFQIAAGSVSERLIEGWELDESGALASVTPLVRMAEGFAPDSIAGTPNGVYFTAGGRLYRSHRWGDNGGDYTWK